MRFGVEPATVPYSTGDATSIVEVTVTMTNDSELPVSCGPLVLTIPFGATSTDLTSDPSTITTAPGDDTPWAVATSGDGTVYAATLPPATGLDPGATIRFHLGAVVVNRSPGTAGIAIAATLDGSRTAASVDIHKDRPAGPGDGVPVIHAFTAEPAGVGQGCTATLSWRIDGGSVAVLTPGPVPLPDPATGDLPVEVWQSTIYRLTALGPGGPASAETLVAVMPVVIDTFTADPSGPVLPGTAVTLRWSVRYARSRSIDQGVGPVAADGSVVVRPTATAVYTLSAGGLDDRSQALTVRVLP